MHRRCDARTAAAGRCRARRSCGGDDDEAPTPRPRGRVGVRGAGHHRVVAHTEQRPGLSLWKDIASEFEAEHPNVTIDITVYENEAFKTKIAGACRPATRPTSSSRGAAASWRSRSTPAWSRTSPTTSSRGSTTSAGAVGSTRSTASSTASRSTSAWSASGTTRRSSSRRASTTPPATWDEFLADVRSSRTPASRRSPSAEGQVAGHVLVGLPRLRIGGKDAMQQAGRTFKFDSEPFVEGRRAAPAR